MECRESSRCRFGRPCTPPSRPAWQVCFGQALFEDVEVALITFFFAELFLDGLELLAQHVLPLVLAHLLFDLGVDALAHLEDLELTGEQAKDLPNAFLGVESLQKLGLLVYWRVEIRGHQVGKLAVLLNRIDERARFARQLGHELNDLLGNVAEAHCQRFTLDVLGTGLFEPRYTGPDVRLGGHDLLDADAHQALKDEAVVAGAVLERFENPRRHTDRVEVVLVGIVCGRISLRHDRNDGLIEVFDILDERNRLLAAHIEGRHRSGKEHGVTNRQDGKLAAELDFSRIGRRDRCNCFLFVAHGGVLLQLGRTPSFSNTAANIVTHHFPGKGLSCGAACRGRSES